LIKEYMGFGVKGEVLLKLFSVLSHNTTLFPVRGLEGQDIIIIVDLLLKSSAREALGEEKNGLFGRCVRAGAAPTFVLFSRQGRR